MKVGVIQMSCISGDKESNLKKAEKLLGEACENGAELIVLPELFNSGYLTNGKDWENAESPDGETYNFLRGFADKYKTVIFGGFIEKSNVEGLVYNSVMCVKPDSKAEVYRKMYLWGAEKNRFLKGDKVFASDCGKYKAGSQICYEAGFPENARMLALDGASVLCYSAAFGKARFYAWDLATRARALENGMFVLAANKSSVEGDIEFCASSRIINPKGEIIALAEKEDEVIYADIDLSDVVSQRDAIPYLRDINLNETGKKYLDV